MASRKAYIDVAKFLGIFLVLMNHIELTVPFVNFYGGMFYVPVFFVTAGMTFYNKEEGLFVFSGKKAKRLLVPYFVCNGFLYVFFLGKSLIGQQGIGKEQLTALIGIFYSRNSLYIPGYEPNVYFMTILNSPTWFLTAIFLTYILLKCSFLVTKGRKKALVAFTVCMLSVGTALHYFCPILLPWSLECIPLFYCYMIVGYFIREEQLLERKKLLYPLLLAGTPLFVLLCHKNGSANISVGMFGESVLLGLFNGLFSSLLVLWLCKAGEACMPKRLTECLSSLGRITLSLLCYHMFVFALLQTGLSIVFPSVFGQQKIVDKVFRLGIILCTIAVIAGAKRFFQSGKGGRGK
ncbi:MAG: acyltransferase family protein [Roseburia sp.]|nr:acyltransferase family protein [Roseburia sp.]MCM1278264.1 acyltransferase family protein [Robinsoniella sp.]